MTVYYNTKFICPHSDAKKLSNSLRNSSNYVDCVVASHVSIDIKNTAKTFLINATKQSLKSIAHSQIYPMDNVVAFENIMIYDHDHSITSVSIVTNQVIDFYKIDTTWKCPIDIISVPGFYVVVKSHSHGNINVSYDQIT